MIVKKVRNTVGFVAGSFILSGLLSACCFTVGGQHACIVPGTPTPAVTPTSAPTVAPTNIPTINPTVAPTSVPTSVPTVAPASVPPVFKVNGGQVPDPGTGKVGFTLFFRCPSCTHNQAWPCDSDHAGWQGGQPFGPWDGRGGDVALMYNVCSGRSWDATCESVGSFVQAIYPGDAHFVADPGRNCYSGHVEFTPGTKYNVCLPAHAKACKDPHDYINDEDWVNGCAHGEVELTDHTVCEGPFPQ